jgi:hypothetical protein
MENVVYVALTAFRLAASTMVRHAGRLRPAPAALDRPGGPPPACLCPQCLMDRCEYELAIANSPSPHRNNGACGAEWYAGRAAMCSCRIPASRFRCGVAQWVREETGAGSSQDSSSADAKIAVPLLVGPPVPWRKRRSVPRRVRDLRQGRRKKVAKGRLVRRAAVTRAHRNRERQHGAGAGLPDFDDSFRVHLLLEVQLSVGASFLCERAGS